MIDPAHVAFIDQSVTLPLWFVLVLAAYSNRRIIEMARKFRRNGGGESPA